MYNRVILMGRLTRDPEFKQTAAGVPVCRISIAVNRKIANKDTGEREADFVDCDAWRGTAEFIARYFEKGNMIHVEGELRNNNYTDQNGVNHYGMRVLIDNVCFCGSKSEGSSGGGQQQSQQSGYKALHDMPRKNQAQRQTSPARSPQAAAPAQEQLDIGDLGEFEEILSDGDCPF